MVEKPERPDSDATASDWARYADELESFHEAMGLERIRRNREMQEEQDDESKDDGST